jgi:GxxExxY protein
MRGIGRRDRPSTNEDHEYTNTPGQLHSYIRAIFVDGMLMDEPSTNEDREYTNAPGQLHSCIRVIFVDGVLIDEPSTEQGCYMTRLVQDATRNDLTYRIIGAAMAVHNAIGPGYKEEIYERALAAELTQLGIAAQPQYPVEVEHAGAPVGLFYLDLLFEGVVVVEIKAFGHQLTNDELAQVINYLKATGASVGLLFNFGRRRLEYRRVFPGKAGAVQRIGHDDVRKADRGR